MTNTSHDYITADEFRAYIKDHTTVAADLVSSCITAASRMVDAYCGRYFYQQDETQYYFPLDWWNVDLEDMDIATTVGLTVTTDDGSSGTYATTRTLGTDFILEPQNQSSHGINPWPYEQMRIIAPQDFWPIHYVPWQQRTVKVVATFGWPAVPAAIKQATKILAAQLFKMSDAPLGVVGFNGWGEVRVKDVPLAANLLRVYCKTGGYGIA